VNTKEFDLRISLINLNFLGFDAIGKCMLDQVRYFRRRGDEVCVYTVHPPKDLPQDVAALTRTVSLADLIARRDAHFSQSDLYVYHYPGDYPLMESIKGIDRGFVMFYYHNVTPPELWGSSFEQDHLRHSRDKISTYVPYADVCVADSDYNSDELVNEHGCERDRVRTLPLAVDVSQFAPGPQDLSLVEKYGLGGRAVILFLGRMAHNKRVDLLVEALPLVRQQVPDAVLLLVGDESSNPAIQECVTRIKARAGALGVLPHVIFTGPVENTPPFYRLASVYASASLHEGFGVPLIEAMASGVPVVASRATAHPLVVGDAGLLAEPDDAADLARQIVRVLTDDALCAELVRRGLDRARVFSLDNYESGWARIVAEAKALLPERPQLRTRLVPASSAPVAAPAAPAQPVPALRSLLQREELDGLNATADVMLRGYRVTSRAPLVGRLIAWVRRNMTSHLREPYLDPTLERQVAFNRQLVQAVRRLAEEQAALASAMPPPASQDTGKQAHTAAESLEPAGAGEGRLEQRLARLESWLTVISAQLSLLESAAHASNGAAQSAQSAQVRQDIDALRKQLK
jgi:glycosyltransferase involved in cell wall biosynthesis